MDQVLQDEVEVLIQANKAVIDTSVSGFLVPQSDLEIVFNRIALNNLCKIQDIGISCLCDENTHFPSL
jgi:hypothetical protein